MKENMMCQNSNGKFNNRIKFKFNQKIYIKIMRCKIVRFQKFMWRNMKRSTKSQKVLVLHYSTNRKPVRYTGKLLKIKSKLILIPFTSFVEFFLFIYFFWQFKMLQARSIKKLYESDLG